MEIKATLNRTLFLVKLRNWLTLERETLEQKAIRLETMAKQEESDASLRLRIKSARKRIMEARKK